VVLDVTRINFRGRDESLIFQVHFGNLEKRASLSFDKPLVRPADGRMT